LITDKDGYQIISLSKNGKIDDFAVHRLVAAAFVQNPDAKPCVDHIDRNPANNIVSNLRYATVSENARNRTVSKNSLSGLKGAVWHARSGKWRAQIMIDRKKHYIGTYDNAQDAHDAYCAFAAMCYGEYACF
jgi:hypothetical protein